MGVKASSKVQPSVFKSRNVFLIRLLVVRKYIILDIACVVGIRPNFVYIASFLSELNNHKNILSTLIHPDSHYDKSIPNTENGGGAIIDVRRRRQTEEHELVKK